MIDVSRRRTLGLLALGVAVPSFARAQTRPLQIGVVPNVNARLILTNYQPFRDQLQRALNRPVEIVTASDFRAFFERMAAGDYDLSVAPANLARLAELDHGLLPFGCYEPGIPGVLAMWKDRPVRDVAELRGKTLALSNPQSLVALRGIAWLEARGLVRERDYRTIHARNDESLAQLLSTGEAPLAMMSRGELMAVHADLRGRIEEMAEFARVPGFVLSTARALPAAEAQALRAAVFALPQSDDGREFMRRAGVQVVRALAPDEMARLDDTVAATRGFMTAR
jgi:phosphonate transport system substrate-binding protein